MYMHKLIVLITISILQNSSATASACEVAACNTKWLAIQNSGLFDDPTIDSPSKLKAAEDAAKFKLECSCFAEERPRFIQEKLDPILSGLESKITAYRDSSAKAAKDLQAQKEADELQTDKKAKEFNCPSGTTFRESKSYTYSQGKRLECIDSKGDEQGLVVEYDGTRKAQQIEYRNGQRHGRQLAWGIDGKLVEEKFFVGSDEVSKTEFPNAKLSFELREACEVKDYGKCVELGKNEIKDGNSAAGKARFQQACDAGNAPGCQELKSLETAQVNAAKKEAEESRIQQEKSDKVEKLQSTKECKAAKAARNYCKNLAGIKLAEANITRENKVGKESGYVNKGVLHNNASAKIQMQEASVKNAQIYQAGLGQSINASFCQIVQYDGTNRVGFGPIDSARKKISSLVERHCGIDEEE